MAKRFRTKLYKGKYTKNLIDLIYGRRKIKDWNLSGFIFDITFTTQFYKFKNEQIRFLKQK